MLLEVSNFNIIETMEDYRPREIFKPFSLDTVTEDIQRIAELELHERVEEIPKCLDVLRGMLEREKDLTPCLDDSFLLMFLRARKFDCQATFNLIKSYYMAPVTYPSMFKNFTPRSCMNVINASLHYFLPYRNVDGCAILLSRFGQWDPRALTCDELLRFNIMCNEMAIKNPVTQICGITTIADMKDFSWSHLLQIQISDVRCFVNTLQDCLPIRHKTIHIINHSSIFSVLFTLVKPLLTEKVRNRIYFHDDVSSLHKHISQEILPESLGGRLTDAPNQDFYNSLLNNDESFVARRNFGYLSRRHLSI